MPIIYAKIPERKEMAYCASVLLFKKGVSNVFNIIINGEVLKAAF